MLMANNGVATAMKRDMEPRRSILVDVRDVLIGEGGKSVFWCLTSGSGG